MITIAEYPQLKLYWYDDERSILVGEVDQGWTWADAHAALRILNDTVKVWSKTQSIYVILDFKQDGQTLPKGESAITNMRQILTDDPSYETMTIMVAQANILGSLINIASRMYKMAYTTSKYRYVTTFEHALNIIRDHKNLG